MSRRLRIVAVVLVASALVAFVTARALRKNIEDHYVDGPFVAEGAEAPSAPADPADGSSERPTSGVVEGVGGVDPVLQLLADTSLRGTQVPGDLTVGPDGAFVADPGALALFDYLLSLEGELSEEAIRDLLRDAIDARLEPPADAQAHAFLARYLDYRSRGDAVFEAADDADSLGERLDRVRALRREVFGDEVAARVFGDSEARDDVALSAREVAADPSLSDAEKRERVAELEESLPKKTRDARAATRAPLESMRAEEAMRARGADPAEIHAHRLDRFGAEGARRLTQLDAQRSKRAKRLGVYVAERDRLARDTSLTPAQRADRLQKWATVKWGAQEAFRLQNQAKLRDRR